MPYPVKSELQAYLTAHGVGASDLARIDPLLDDALESAVAAWETATGYAPFLVDADSEPTTRTFRSLGCLLEFGAGMLPGTPNPDPNYGVVFPQESFSNGAFSPAPIHAVWARHWLDCGFETISITGLWGACTTLPAGVASAILSIAAASITGAISGTAFTAGQVTKEKVGEVETTYAAPASTSSVFGAANALPPAAAKLAARYRRPQSGVA